ncbi:MAG TPA: Holliday junction resolvase RuvX [Marmoricola sp.]|jgi:putative Holliday junction resolvase|nr:Holliday junction resolvase RuvX [Marmoricola sp.]
MPDLDPRGARLGIDPGDARIGVATCDPSGILATPVETVSRGDGDLDRLAALADELGSVLVYVGLPRSLRGGEGPAAGKVRAFAQELAARVAPLSVRLVDERMSTVTAEAVLRNQGKKGQKRRAVVDQAAAVVILQSAIDTERISGRPTGELVVLHEDPR